MYKNIDSFSGSNEVEKDNSYSVVKFDSYKHLNIHMILIIFCCL